MNRFMLAATALLAACGGSSPADAGYWTVGSGHLNGPTVTATISNASVYFTDLGNDAGYALQIELAGQDDENTTGTLSFTQPTSAPKPALSSTITISDLPAATSYNNTSADVCGGLFIGTNGETGVNWNASAMASCTGINHNMPIGIWTLKLTQVSRSNAPPTNGGAGYLTAHGTLNGTMSDGAGGHTATLELSFP